MRVDHLALLVEHVVVLQHALPDLEVLLLHLLLSAFHRAGDQPVLDGLVLFEPHPVHETVDPLASEEAHQIVFQGDVEAAETRVPLASRPPAQLVVDPPRLVPFGPQHVEAAQLHHAVAQLDVRAAAGHVGGDGDRARLPGVGHDGGLAGVLLGVEDLVRDAPPGQHGGKPFGLLHGDGAHQDRLAALVAVGQVLDHGSELRRLVLVDQIFLVVADQRPVGRDHDDFHAVDLAELVCLGGGGTSHAGDLLVETEVVLQGDGGEGLVLLLDLDAFLRLDRLVEPSE